ncbi:MAG TPA: hypothetical protein PLX18_09250 [Anaerohalosphaeraceae bacterium]|jgi:hypothetical protein|nr:hypothetical protein [Anaerohalosphaeraceae bacterium]HOT73904.1 hypothetical protein [Anaerohalosphaeraceae bacterium]HPB93983.1 hypothetical protein [Anaerohalosphaeraceae bacterium]HQG06583.1 hypothetical protein [Anaerohalosphaeraceae bacterium]HQI08023.1 hypothetical protein [Anaerohalosphaeraceae bacterium]
MDLILRESKTSSHFSISFVIAGGWTAEPSVQIDFQKALLENGLEFSQTNFYKNGFQLRREAPSSPLQILLESPAPQIHNLKILAISPNCDLDYFCREAEAVTIAYQQIWPAEQYQILNTTARIDHLYSTKIHAFQYLWENRLNQSPEDFKALGGRPVHGGGLRLLIPPHSAGTQEPVTIELRIESFLREPSKLLVETAFTWPKPRIISREGRFGPRPYLETVENFAATEVWNFITKSNQ